MSKYQEDNNPNYNLPENVASFAGRLNLSYKGFGFLGEYAYKMNDPSADNGYIFKEEGIIGPYIFTGIGGNYLGGEQIDADFNSIIPLGLEPSNPRQ